VQIRVDHQGPRSISTLSIELNAAVRWQLTLSAGARTSTVDFAAGILGGIGFTTGISEVQLRLPAPHGTVPVTLGGGLDRVALTLPVATPARVLVERGAARVTLDGQAHTGVGNGAVFTLNGYDRATNRYEVAATAGMTTLDVSH
jgi:hypothetical protein